MTAAGEILHCSETENAELLWCARGAGPGNILSGIWIRLLVFNTITGFPAIVTRFHLKVRPKPAVTYQSTFIYPISQYKTVMDWVIKVMSISLHLPLRNLPTLN